MINILIVDDSETETLLLKELFEAEKDMRVIGYAKNGEEAVKLNTKLKPDIITMDIIMPVMNGVEATRLIMSQNPVPIVIISSAANEELVKTTFSALDAGAVSVLEKPENITSALFEHQRKRIIDTVRNMSQIKVIKRRFHVTSKKSPPVLPSKIMPDYIEIIAIGVSVGGPQALKTICSRLPPQFPIPIVIVQHMTQGFITGFTHWLDKNCDLTVKLAENNETLSNGTIYFAPDSYHLKIRRVQGKLTSILVKSPPVSGFCPSATVLLQSVAEVSRQHALGILLTGMGSDGAEGLLELKMAKGHTIIQDKESAVVFGMAGVAQSLNAVDKIIPLDKIADYLIKIAQGNKTILKK